MILFGTLSLTEMYSPAPTVVAILYVCAVPLPPEMIGSEFVNADQSVLLACIAPFPITVLSRSSSKYCQSVLLTLELLPIQLPNLIVFLSLPTDPLACPNSPRGRRIPQCSIERPRSTHLYTLRLPRSRWRLRRPMVPWYSCQWTKYILSSFRADPCQALLQCMKTRKTRPRRTDAKWFNFI